MGAQRTELPFTPDSEFVRFIADLVPGSGRGLPPLGILAGNAATAGQRFIILVFDAKGRPAVVVKAGLSARARELITKEQRFLAAVSAGSPGIPSLRASFQSAKLQALALDFLPGRSPQLADGPALPRLLSAWMHTGQQILLCQTQIWSELKAACSEHPVFQAIAPRLEPRRVSATITHGDLAPWNIKVQRNGAWMVLDWERGDLHGIPACDWFHFVIQPAILVHRQGPSSLVDRLEGLLGSPPFQAYALPAGVVGVEREVALAYLLHHNEIIRPSEGLETGRALLAALAQRWLKLAISPAV
jgi:hypothetical protein